jgi:thymidylate synthase ThyX
MNSYKSVIEGKGGITAKVVADSIANGIRLITMELRYPRFIHSEVMTHRMFSRNASSSRAIPVAKMIEQVETYPASPIHWGKNQAGMQAYEEHNAPSKGIEEWHNTASQAVSYAKQLNHLGFHKQIVNRLLEPFQFITTVVTATEWDNFFLLRDHHAAQPEIRELAKVMKQAQDESTPDELSIGDWHLPYITAKDTEKTVIEGHSYSVAEVLTRCSAARCARVSYMKHDGSNPSVEDDLELYNMLAVRPYTDKRGTFFDADDPVHLSPLEHQATPMTQFKNTWSDKGQTHMDRDGNMWSGNFRGWLQHRQML